ncbi:peptide chain release factor 1 [Fistulifera solaris]|uniref:Peptide chain release factor 1 n=1 Tax=Fistulifera solaris TaxID=1519565 RepID=A0A1Z5JDJ5_FISSO|nr:peptide chain release factor 1 [Fistulifera solaris]|eukprot:GAX12067.1 peptide chain release factor 1 [Fistulifera solaris]
MVTISVSANGIRMGYKVCARQIPKVVSSSVNKQCCVSAIFHRHFKYFSMISAAVEGRLQSMKSRHDEIMEEMKSAGHTSPAIGKELSKLMPVVNLMEKWEALVAEEASLRDLLAELKEDEIEMKSECLEELDLIHQKQAMLTELMMDAAIPQDEDESDSDAIVEVRAGTGGDEASLFAAELVACYINAAKLLSWKVEVLSESRTDIGGLREASLSIVAGNGPPYRLARKSDDEVPLDDGSETFFTSLGPYGTFKFESGVHRVQRVPVNDSRIHTSACSVAVLPSLPDDSKETDLLPMSELKIETMRASGAGGQHVNTTDSAVRITHLPTKITASIQDERSQHKNKEKALRLVAARVRDFRKSTEEKARGETRSSLMGGGDRSERIRTYNFPQDRVTDHRSKESHFGINALLNTEANIVLAFLPLLHKLHREEKIERLGETNTSA